MQREINTGTLIYVFEKTLQTPLSVHLKGPIWYELKDEKK